MRHVTYHMWHMVGGEHGRDIYFCKTKFSFLLLFLWPCCWNALMLHLATRPGHDPLFNFKRWMQETAGLSCVGRKHWHVLPWVWYFFILAHSLARKLYAVAPFGANPTRYANSTTDRHLINVKMYTTMKLLVTKIHLKSLWISTKSNLLGKNTAGKIILDKLTLE